MLKPSGPDLVLVVPPNRIDVITVRAYVLGHFVCLTGGALMFPRLAVWDLPARLFIAGIGLWSGYAFSQAFVHNPIVPIHFVFQPGGRLVVTKPSGQQLWSGKLADASLELRRKAAHGVGRFEWKHAGMSTAADLSEEDVEALRQRGVSFVQKGAPALRTRFTRSERRWWYFWSVVWSVPWWGLLYRVLT